MTMVIEQDAQDYYPLDAPFAMHEEDAMRLGGHWQNDRLLGQQLISADGALADLFMGSELWNENDNDDDDQAAVAAGRLCVPNLQINNSIAFGQAYNDYIRGCYPSSAADDAGASRPEAPHSSGLLHDTNTMVYDASFNRVEEHEEPGNDFHRENHWYYQVYNSHGQQMQFDDLASDYHGDTLLDFELHNDNDDTAEDRFLLGALGIRLLVPHIEDTPTMFNEAYSNNGFGGVPASAAAIAGLKEQKYDGSGSDDGCVICMKDYKKDDRLVVMPCTYMHRYHGKCLEKWLSQSHLCPLCRHALPTEEQNEHKMSI
ncbi:hypothetical protein EJB05_29497, partial [Eragrostis curvula]